MIGFFFFNKIWFEIFKAISRKDLYVYSFVNSLTAIKLGNFFEILDYF